MIVFGNIDHGNAIAAHAGFVWNPSADQVISITDNDGKLLGGAIYEKFLGNSIFGHVSGLCENWLSRDALWVAFHYPFVQLGCQKLLGMTPSANVKALEFARRLGFTEVGRVTDAYRDGDLVVFEMDRKDCRWLSLAPRTIRSG
jgi:RimJ/RimL family protein N-acetyltransferase